MPSLTEAYQRNARDVSSLRRVYAGTALVVAGGALAVLAVIVAATDLAASILGSVLTARLYGGVLGGLAVPVALVGVFTVLPTGRRIRAAAAISASICLLGVALFWYAYPHHWAGYGRDLTAFVSTVYLIGFFASVWCLFTAVVNFKTRNDPGGALEMNVTRRGRTKVVEVENSTGLGSVGFLGSTPDGDVETQTATSGASADVGPTPTSDGGATTDEVRSPMDDVPPGAEIVERPSPPTPTDRYCGNCRHFEYVRSSNPGIAPYCRYHDATMDDMDACDDWTPNR